MLITILFWVAVGTAAWGYGTLLLPIRGHKATAGLSETPELGPRCYCGLLIICGALLVGALVRDIAWWMGVLVMAPGILLGLWTTRGAHIRLSPPSLASAAAISLLAATRQVSFYDTGLYHQQVVKWLASYGVVRGIALLNFRFGWSSSWFAWAATLNHGPLEGREAAMVGGAMLTLIVTVAIEGLRSIVTATRGGRIHSWTRMIFSTALAVAMLAWNIESSLSADPVVWMLPLMLVLIICDEEQGATEHIGAAVILAALGCAVRLTCLPMLLYATALWIMNFLRGETRIRLLTYAVGACVPLAAVMTSNWRASGCPLFPSPVGCSAGESSVGAAFAAEVSAYIRTTLAQSNRHFAVCAFLALATSTAALWLGRRDRFVLHSIGVSLSGIVFLTTTRIPDPRYGLGYFCLPVAVLGAQLLERLVPHCLVHINARRIRIVAACALVVVIGICMPGIREYGLVIPARMPRVTGDPVRQVSRSMNVTTTLNLVKVRRGNLEFLRPEPELADQCWDASLPCTRETTVDRLQLRNAKIGLGAGFASEAVRRVPQ